MTKIKNDSPQQLLRKLLVADSEEDVREILDSNGYWDKPNAWRHYGDKEGNFGHIGAQQSQPDAALVEKLTNSIDALLLGECRARGIDPEGPSAPKSMSEAVALLFGSQSGLGAGNSMSEWVFDKARIAELAKRLQIAVTGSKQRPCISIVDLGEGQRPDSIPDTFVSLDRQNKARIGFVQGKFNMGGSGVLRFCGSTGLQLILSKRDPRVVSALKETHADSGLWGFTIVRREETDGRSSTYTYLAPIECDQRPRRGGVLRFAAEDLDLLPIKRDAYAAPVSHASLVKLYEYDLKGFASNAIFPDQLRGRLEVKLPEPALPIRITECRSYGGHSGSNSTSINGVVNRLSEDRKDNIEPGFPSSVQMIVDGEHLSAKIYAFKPKKRESYFSATDGIIFVVNGQTHGSVKQSFYTQKRVNMQRLSGSIVTVVDCTTLSQIVRENIFMTSRDRLSDNAITKRLYEQLADVIKNHSGLRELAAKRKEEEIKNQLKDDQPLERILERLLRTSPALEKLLPKGMRLPSIGQTGSGGNGAGISGRGDSPFVGKPHPTVLKFDGKAYGHVLERNFEIGHRCRLRLETDVVNDYFDRDSLAGFYDVSPTDDSGVAPSATISLHDGIASISLDFGSKLKPGEKFSLAITVNDDTLVEPFVNVVHLTALEEREHPSGGEVRHNGSKPKGDKNGGPGALSLPKVTRVSRDQWDSHSFDAYSAASIIEEDDAVEVFVNVDNYSLKAAQKSTKEDARIVETRFILANALLSLGILQRFEEFESKKTLQSASADDPVRVFAELGAAPVIQELTRASAPFLLTMIDALSSLGDDQVIAMSESIEID